MVNQAISGRAISTESIFLPLFIQAHKPDSILSDQVVENDSFERLSFRFTKRFQRRTFGYTFFGLFTMKKQTLLGVSIVLMLHEQNR